MSSTINQTSCLTDLTELPNSLREEMDQFVPVPGDVYVTDQEEGRRLKTKIVFDQKKERLNK